jgi:hypothetical protein
VNGYLIGKGISEGSRNGIAATTREFHRRNDCPLFVDFRLQGSSG